eukprot:scaffold906_cov395-Prasinococcus_capsulatus_cf.AAC.8
MGPRPRRAARTKAPALSRAGVRHIFPARLRSARRLRPSRRPAGPLSTLPPTISSGFRSSSSSVAPVESTLQAGGRPARACARAPGSFAEGEA